MTLESIANSIVENGTRAEAPVLEAMALLVRPVAPGASAALVDWSGPEVVRLRAFDLVARTIARDLPEFDVADLLVRSTATHAA